LESLHIQFGLIHQQMGQVLANMKMSLGDDEAPEGAKDAKEHYKIDPLWFDNLGNRHLSELGKKKLRELLSISPKLGHGEIGRMMSIHRNAVSYWADKWDLD
jgi:hypothetical protein